MCIIFTAQCSYASAVLGVLILSVCVPVHKPSGPYIEPITEERANRCLARIDLLCKIREQILHNPLLDERIGLCQSSGDMPEWWVCGVHDRDLLVGAAR